MKKILTVCIALMTAVTLFGRDYQHSLGIVGGLGIGVQYKGMVADNVTVMEELGYFINPNGGTGFGYAAFLNNTIVAYQDNILEEDGVKLDWYAGGQLKIGYGASGVFGFGAAAGVEANMTNAPISLSFDFRPGYGLLFGNNGAGGTTTAHLFDYSLNLGVRYTF